MAKEEFVNDQLVKKIEEAEAHLGLLQQERPLDQPRILAVEQRITALRQERVLVLHERVLALTAALQNKPGQEAGERLYIIRHVHKTHRFKGPPYLSLGDIAAAAEKKWKLFEGAEYEILLEDKKLTEATWQSFLTSRPCNEAVSVKVKTLGQPFLRYQGCSGGQLADLAKQHLGVVTFPDGFPMLDDASFPLLQLEYVDRFEGQTWDELLDLAVLQTRLTASALRQTSGAKETSQRDFISPVLVIALHLARTKGPGSGGSLFLESEFHIVGKMAWGPIDYVVIYKLLAVMVVEAKRGLVHQSWGQVMMQISAARDSLLRRLCNPKDAKKRAHWEATELSSIPTCAILCTATDYRLLLYKPTPDGNGGRLVVSRELQVLTSSAAPGLLREMLRPLLLRVAGMVVEQMKAIDLALQANPQLTNVDPLSGPAIIADEEEAAADHPPAEDQATE